MPLKPFTPDCAFWHGFMRAQFRAAFWRTWGILIAYMISDVADIELEACLQMVRFLICFGVLIVEKIAEFLKCVGSLRQGCGATLQLQVWRIKWFALLWILRAIEMKVKTCLERDEMPRLPQMMTATVTMTIQKKSVEGTEWTQYIEGQGAWSWEKCDVVVVVVMVGCEDNKCKMLVKNRYYVSDASVCFCFKWFKCNLNICEDVKKCLGSKGYRYCQC